MKKHLGKVHHRAVIRFGGQEPDRPGSAYGNNRAEVGIEATDLEDSAAFLARPAGKRSQQKVTALTRRPRVLPRTAATNLDWMISAGVHRF